MTLGQNINTNKHEARAQNQMNPIYGHNNGEFLKIRIMVKMDLLT